MGHLDPTDRGELYACEVQAPQTCQAGDLAGKHGNITTPTFMAKCVPVEYLLHNLIANFFLAATPTRIFPPIPVPPTTSVALLWSFTHRTPLA